MELFSLIFYMIFQTTLIGTTSYLVWRLICLLTKERSMRYRYGFLKIQLVFWLVPIGMFLNYRKYYDFEAGTFRGTLILAPFGVYELAVLAVVVWLVGCFVMWIKRRKDLKLFRALIEMNEPVDEDVEAMAQEILKELAITKKIHVCWNPLATTAMTYGTKEFYVLLPGMDYTDEELQILLRHELTHIQKRDVFVKKIVALVHITQWFNPFATDYKREFFLWSEIDCDYRVCMQGIGFDSYIRFLTEQECSEVMLPEEDSYFLYSVPTVADRVEALEKMRKTTGWKKVTAVLCGVLFVALVASNAYAASGMVEEPREDISKASFDKEAEGRNEGIEVVLEYQKPAQIEGLLIQDMDTELDMYTGYYSNQWNMSPGSFYSKSIGSLSVGDKVDVMVRAEEGVEVGLYYNGTLRYFVAADGVSNHTFTINWNGTHRIYAENPLDHTVEVTIAVFY